MRGGNRLYGETIFFNLEVEALPLTFSFPQTDSTYNVLHAALNFTLRTLVQVLYHIEHPSDLSPVRQNTQATRS